MRVLYVDDEPPKREAFRGVARELPLEWRVEVVADGAAALAHMEKTAIDVVVCDFRMPGMDGAAVLQAVSERFPAAVRVVTNAPVEEDATLRAVPLAHQFLPASAPARHVEGVIRRACEVQSLLADPETRAVVGDVKLLPPSPKLHAELSRLLDDPTTPVEKVVAAVGRDPAISAKILRLVNSSFFARGSRIGDLRAAVVRLGLRVVRALALSVEVFNKLPPNLGVPGFSVEALQEASLKRSALVEKMLPDPVRRGNAMLAAMLTDVGQLVLAMTAKDKLAASIARAQRDQVPLEVAEKAVYGSTHANVGAYLLSIWGLPAPLVEGVAHHHTPRFTLVDGLDAPGALYVATCLLERRAPDAGWVQVMGLEGALEGWRAHAEALGG